MTTKITQDTTGLQFFHCEEPLELEQGGVLSRWTLAFESYGQLNATKKNGVLIHHALSTHSHVASHAKNETPGWWEKMVGANKPIDSTRYFILCVNNLGSCFGSTGPTSVDPQTQKPYGPEFPSITFQDIVHAQYRLLQFLGIDTLHAIVSASMGAMISLEWAVHYPASLKKLVLISSTYKAYPSHCANRAIQREIIQLDPAWAGGHYQKKAIEGFKIARKIGHLYYRNSHELNERFEQDKAEIERYLEYNATKFVSNFDANSYLCLLEAMDTFDLGRHFGSFEAACARIKAKILVISVNSDILFPPQQQLEMLKPMQQQGIDVHYIPYESVYGHDSFLVEIQGIGTFVDDFLE